MHPLQHINAFFYVLFASHNKQHIADLIPREQLLLQPVSLKCYCHTGCSHRDDGGIIVPPEVRRLRPDAVTHPPVAVD